MQQIYNVLGQHSQTLTGQIDTVGVLRILGHLRQRYPSEYGQFNPRSVDWVYKGQSGKIAKQTARLWRQQTGHSLTDDDRMQIGTIARHFSAIGQVSYDITTDFTWNSGDYGDAGSCFWWNNGQYRGAIYDANGAAMRFYKDDQFSYGVSRAWILPVHDNGYPSSNDFDDIGDRTEYVIFNQYGQHDIQIFAETLRLTLGALHAVPVCLDFDGAHINASPHYLITDRTGHSLYGRLYNPDALPYSKSSYPSVDLESSCNDTRYCSRCQCQAYYDDLLGTSGSDYYDPDDDMYCSDCWSECYTRCESCEQTIGQSDALSDADGSEYCQYCYDNYVAPHCDFCGNESDGKTHDTVRRYDVICNDCYTDGTVGQCSVCQDHYITSESMSTVATPDADSVLICDDCIDRYDVCENCDKYTESYVLSDHNVTGHLLCPNCVSDCAECHICGSAKMDTALHYDPSDLSAENVLICPDCSRINFDNFVRLPDLLWPPTQIALYTECQGQYCQQVYPLGLRDSGLCILCERQDRVPYVRTGHHAGMIAYIGQQYRRYIDAVTPDLTDADPVALLTGPISQESQPYTTYNGLIRAYDDPVCHQCQSQSVRISPEYMRRVNSQCYENVQITVQQCIDCCHRPDAVQSPTDADDPTERPDWDRSEHINLCQGQQYPLWHTTVQSGQTYGTLESALANAALDHIESLYQRQEHGR